jgi:F-type H+-transporting ATPase subunit epsilon
MAEQERTDGEGGEFAVTVITPRGAVAEVRADAVTAPGKIGEFELLPQHLPFLTALRPGVLTLGEQVEKKIYAVGSGFLRVDLDGSVEILVEEAIAGEDVDVEPMRAEASETQDAMDTWNQALDGEFQRMQYRHEWASAQLEAHRRSRP